MNKSQVNFIKLMAFYSCAVFLIYLALLITHVVYAIPNNVNLLNWDSNWYNSIRSFGYEYVEAAQCNLAFFPLFPTIWNLTNLSPIGMAIFNGLIFQLSFYFLLRKEKFNFLFFLFILCTPSFIFFYLPYSESIFFLCSTIALNGMRNNSPSIKLIGLFFASTARSVSVIFVPALIICELVFSSSADNFKTRSLRTAISCLASLCGLCVTIVFQGLQTGKWLYFTSVMKYWDRTWIFPKFPLTTSNPTSILWLDALAFMVGIIAMAFCFKWVFQTFISNEGIFKVEVPPHIFFSALFLSAITILDVCLTNTLNNSTNIWSLNRHLSATAFSVTFLVWLQKYPVSNKEGFALVILLALGIYLTGVFQYPLQTIYYLSYVITFILFKIKVQPANWVFLVTITLQITLQLTTLEEFLWYRWVG